MVLTCREDWNRYATVWQAVAMFTTPTRPIDITTVFPEFASLAKTATRLHPRRGTPAAASSSMAGPMLWPADEPWPTCGLDHMGMVTRPATDDDRAAFERGRRRRMGGAARLEKSLGDPALTTDRRRSLEKLLRDVRESLDQPLPTTVSVWRSLRTHTPVPMIPVIQLRAEDAPGLCFPGGADLFQLLWCPHSHGEVPGQPELSGGPAPTVRWRAASRALTTVGPTNGAGPGEWVLTSCVLHPEQIVEYPDFRELPEPVRARVLAWHDPFEAATGHTYRKDLSTAPGLKAGGWAFWPDQVRPPRCGCGADTTLVLTIPSGERGAQSWTPAQASGAAGLGATEEPLYPTGVSDVPHHILVFACSRDPRHPARFLIE